MHRNYSSARATIQASGFPVFEPEVQTNELKAGQEPEVLAFLAQRPIHTVTLAGLVRDNGLVSPHNRGTFFECRNDQGQLEGVALIGHATLIETTTYRALEAFANIAQKRTDTHMIMGEQERMSEFWSLYYRGGQEMRLACRELLFELRWPIEARSAVPELRLATPADLELIMPVHAEMAFEESGINPMKADESGFRSRCLRRIQQGRTWVVVENEDLIFKADVISDTPEVIYLEGVWLNPAERGKGYGERCLSELGRQLLQRTNSICLLVNERLTKAHDFYRRVGYKLRGVYDTIFLK